MTRPKFYFDRFEHRLPPDPIPFSKTRESVYQFLATITLVLGAWYIGWRWLYSLNPDALWFSIPVALAETCAYIGSALFIYNPGATKDTEQQPPPTSIRDCVERPESMPDRPISIDIFFPTYNEDPELVRLSLQAAKEVEVSVDCEILIHVLDDGNREEMKKVSDEEGVLYISRPDNIGYKAGNMRNGMERTSGDFILIGDADTRVDPRILEETLGYFRDPDVAWVQTPQWFFDLPEGESLDQKMGRWLGAPGRSLANAVQKAFGPVRFGDDPYASDPQLFYDVILRRRNRHGAAFCCGAGSLHRRDAVMQAALRAYAKTVDISTRRALRSISDQGTRDQVEDTLLQKAMLDTEVTPYKFHVSEDIYTSIVLHADEDRDWKSVYHPKVLCKMLSPQDLQSWIIQQFKYAGGTLDIAFRDRSLWTKLPWRKRLFYASTFWSYIGGLWNLVFLISPIVYLLSGAAPVRAYTLDFFLHIVPFLACYELANMAGLWGIAGFKAKASYLGRFSLSLRALWLVARGREIHFPTTPKERQDGRFFQLVAPQAAIFLLTAVGIAVALVRYSMGANYQLSGIFANSLWGLNNMIAMGIYVGAAFWTPPSTEPHFELDLDDHAEPLAPEAEDPDAAGVTREVA